MKVAGALAALGHLVYIDLKTGGLIMIVPFETFESARMLRDKARAPRDRAEAISRICADTTAEPTATKTDLQGTETRLGAGIADFKSDLRQTEARLAAKIAEVKAQIQIVKWMMGAAISIQLAIFVKLVMH